VKNYFEKCFHYHILTKHKKQCGDGKQCIGQKKMKIEQQKRLIISPSFQKKGKDIDLEVHFYGIEFVCLGCE
jgi:hypothetical protein